MSKRYYLFLVPICGLIIGFSVGWRKTNTTSLSPTPTPSLTSTISPTPTVSAISENAGSVNLIAVGDIMLARYVEKAYTSRNDLNYPFEKISKMIQGADLAFANLECPITDGPEVPAFVMRFNCNKGMEVPVHDAGFDIVSVANNHMGDFGAKGVTDTVTALRSIGVQPVGAGETSDVAEAPVILEKNGLKIAFLAYNDHDVVPDAYGASATRAGSNFLDVDKISKAVPEAKKKADIVIVSMHSGVEYKAHHGARQEMFAHAAIDAGAAIVIGHHPHVAEDVEQYKGKYILYSLGNFIFDQTDLPTREGLVAHIRLTKDGVSDLKLSTVLIEHFGQPSPQTEKESQDTFTRIGWVQPSGS